MARNDPAKMFRAPEHEIKAIDQAIEESGMPAGVWIRAMLLAACGDMTLLNQARRARAAGKKASE